ncbi:hypothetical protein V3C99_016002, partial [Haemonchus contortus]
CIAVLLAVNRRLHLLTRGRGSLSSRYQISENVRALRLVAPVILLDTSVTITDMIGTLFFDVRPAFDRDSYESGSSRYLVAYIVLRGAAVILQYGIPVAIVSHETLRKVACGSLSKVTGKPCAQTDEVDQMGRSKEMEQHAVFLEHLFNSIMIGVYSLAIIIFTAVVLLMLKARSLFHPLFCLLFSLIIILYIICNILMVIYMSLIVLDYKGIKAYVIIGTIYQGAYIYLTCTVIFCVMERFLATVFSKTYEFRRNWFVLIVGQITALIIVFLHIRVYRIGGTTCDMVQLGFSFVIFTCIVVLLVVNRRLRRSTRGSGSLSSRYQISENVRALRLVAPVVLLDTGITIADMVGALFFDVRPAFDRDSYESGSSRYLIAYIALRGAVVILQYGIPVAIVSHETLRKVACGSLSKVTGKPSCTQTDEVRVPFKQISSTNH